MRVLLDTHAFLWFNMSSRRLSLIAQNLIEDAATEVLISPASYWELAIKMSTGKFALSAPYEQFWREGIEENGFSILPIELSHTSRLIDLPFHHKDPFDRLLIAQALAEGLPLVSHDLTFDVYGVERIW